MIEEHPEHHGISLGPLGPVYMVIFLTPPYFGRIKSPNPALF